MKPHPTLQTQIEHWVSEAVDSAYHERPQDKYVTVRIATQALKKLFVDWAESCLPEKKKIDWCPSENCHYNKAIEEIRELLRRTT